MEDLQPANNAADTPTETVEGDSAALADLIADATQTVEEAIQETEAAINDIANANETTNEFESAKARAIATLEKLTNEAAAVDNPSLSTDPAIETQAIEQTNETLTPEETQTQMQEEVPPTDEAAIEATQDEPVLVNDALNEQGEVEQPTTNAIEEEMNAPTATEQEGEVGEGTAEEVVPEVDGEAETAVAEEGTAVQRVVEDFRESVVPEEGVEAATEEVPAITEGIAEEGVVAVEGDEVVPASEEIPAAQESVNEVVETADVAPEEVVQTLEEAPAETDVAPTETESEVPVQPDEVAVEGEAAPADFEMGTEEQTIEEDQPEASVQIIDDEQAVLQQEEPVVDGAEYEAAIGDEPIWNDIFEGDEVIYEDLPLFNPEAVDVQVDSLETAFEPQVESEIIEVIEEPAMDFGEFVPLEETKEGFLDASEVDIIPAAPLPLMPKRGNNSVEKNDGISVGAIFAILIFVSILFYIFRKCRTMMQPGNQMARYKNSSDHLSSLL